jgi:hypothetical protein
MTTVKLPTDLVRKVKIEAAAKKPRMTLIEQLTEVIRRPVEKELAKAAQVLVNNSGQAND